MCAVHPEGVNSVRSYLIRSLIVRTGCAGLAVSRSDNGQSPDAAAVAAAALHGFFHFCGDFVVLSWMV